MTTVGREIFCARRQRPSFQDVRIANCAGCGVEVTSSNFNAGLYGLERLFGRICGRPYCKRCFREIQVAGEVTGEVTDCCR